MRVIAAFLCISSLLPFSTLSTQQAPPIEPGARVRITSTDPRLVRSEGTCLELSEGHLQFAPSTTAEFWSIPVDSITALDVSRGRKPFEPAFGGILAGFATGAGLVLLLAEEDGKDAWMVVGIGAGAVGGVLGFLLGSSERWEEVPLERLRLQPVVTPDGRFGLAASVRF